MSRRARAPVVDTGQADHTPIDTGQPKNLAVLHHQIHRVDDADGDPDLIVSTLKSFNLKVGLVDAHEEPVPNAPKLTLTAVLFYDSGRVVEELSTTREPALLGGDEATLEDGVATFKLRITVLSSLCQARRFRVHVTCVERPELTVATASVRTITKLRRGPREPTEPAAAEPEAHVAAPDGRLEESGKRSIEELWDEVSTNGQMLLELQKQQRFLFSELRRIRGARALGAQGGLGAEPFAAGPAFAFAGGPAFGKPCAALGDGAASFLLPALEHEAGLQGLATSSLTAI